MALHTVILYQNNYRARRLPYGIAESALSYSHKKIILSLIFEIQTVQIGINSGLHRFYLYFYGGLCLKNGSFSNRSSVT